MTERSNESRWDARHESRGTGRVQVASESALPADEPEEPIYRRPTLTLVGGTDVTPAAVEPDEERRA